IANRLAGTAKNIGGQVEEGFGRATGDAKMQGEGRARQAEGSLQDFYGQAKENTAGTAEAIRENAREAGDFVRTTSRNHRTRPPRSLSGSDSGSAGSAVAPTNRAGYHIERSSAFLGEQTGPSSSTSSIHTHEE